MWWGGVSSPITTLRILWIIIYCIFYLINRITCTSIWPYDYILIKKKVNSFIVHLFCTVHYLKVKTFCSRVKKYVSCELLWHCNEYNKLNNFLMNNVFDILTFYSIKYYILLFYYLVDIYLTILRSIFHFNGMYTVYIFCCLST